jgi:flavin-dependent dehydrogenase
VVVVGAGPAGSSTALRFARAGFRVALVEPDTFPRFKACGEFMSPDCLPILEDLGVAGDLRALGARPVGSMTLHGHGRRAHGRFVDVGEALAPAGHGWAVRRELFDDALLRAALSAGVELVAARVTGLERGADGEVLGVETRGTDGVPFRLRARLVVGADGLRSRVARELGVVRAVPWLDKLALTTR